MKKLQTIGKIVIVIMLCGLINITRVNAKGSFSCKYTYRGDNDIDKVLGFSSYTLSSGGNTLSEAFDNGAKDQFWDGADQMGKLINGKRIIHGYFDMINYMELASTKCPTNIYFCPITSMGEGKDYFNVFDEKALFNSGYVETYNTNCHKFIWENATDEDIRPNGCYYENATSCKEYTKSVNDKTLYIELGKTSNNNYIMFSYDANFASSYASPNMNSIVMSASDINGNTINVNKDDNDKTFFDYISCTNDSCVYPSDIQLVYGCSLDYKYKYYIFNQGSTYNNIDLDLSSQKCDKKVEPTEPEGPPPIEEINFCERPGILKAFQIVGYVLFVIKILIPLILIGMGTYDFAKAAISSDDKANKTALNSLVRRIIIGVVIFFIPTVINLVINMIDSSINSDLGEGSKFSNCSSCLLDPIDGCDGASLEQTVQKPSGGGQSGGTFGGRK